MTRCTYDPSGLIGVPLGQHHCPNCGCMVIAGLAHGHCDEECEQADQADQDFWSQVNDALIPEDETDQRPLP
jgi:hypothetical protein